MVINLGKYFDENRNCIADTWDYDNCGNHIEGEHIKAMTRDKFIEVVTKILDECGMAENPTSEPENKALNIGCVSESYLHINDAARLIKGMPTEQAIHKMKAILSGQPETIIIKGELLISLHNSH